MVLIIDYARGDVLTVSQRLGKFLQQLEDLLADVRRVPESVVHRTPPCPVGPDISNPYLESPKFVFHLGNGNLIELYLINVIPVVFYLPEGAAKTPKPL